MGSEYTEAKKRAIDKYRSNYVQIRVTAQKDRHEEYKALAERMGKSMNRLIIDLLEAELKK